MAIEKINNLHLGIPILATKTWLGGLAYIENLAKAIKLLSASERPKTSFVITDDTLSLFSLNKNSADYFDELAYVGANPAYAAHELSRPVQHFPNLDALFVYLDCYFPVPNSTLPYPHAVSWIPDFQHKRLPQFFTQEELSSRDEQFARIAENARWLVLSSNCAASDFHTFYPQSQTRLHILHFHTLPPEDWFKGDPSAIQQKYGLPDEFVMCSNQFWTHKDHPVLFNALAKLHKQGKKFHLVCTGSTEDYRTPEYFGQLQQLIRDLELTEYIHILGVIPRQEQIQLVRRSLAMVQPSLFEGWSTVVEDSRALGKTILMSDLPVHIEQAPQNGYYFRQHNVEDLAQKMLEILPGLHSGPDIQREATAIQKQMVLVEGFSRTLCDLVEVVHNQKISATVGVSTVAMRVSALSQESAHRLSAIQSRLAKTPPAPAETPQAPIPSIPQNPLDDALAKLNQELTYAGDDPGLIVKKGNILIQQGDIESARREFVKATVIAPQFALGHAMLGLVLVYLKRFPEAEKALRRALTLDPANATATSLLDEIEREKATPGLLSARPTAVVSAKTFQDFTYSKRSHFTRLRAFGRYLGIPPAEIDPTYDLKAYQDLLVYNFIIDNIPPGSRLLDVGGGNSRIIQELKYRYECWNADKLEGLRSGTTGIEDTSGFRLVRDYIGNFNRQLPENYFDCVFSISALEHTPEDETTFANVLADLDRVLKPGGYSLHTFDIAIFPERIWTNQFLPYLSKHVTSFLHRVVPFDEMLQDRDIYVMSQSAYEKYWQPITKKVYGRQGGLPLSYNLLWQKPAAPAATTERLSFSTPTRQAAAGSQVRTLKVRDYHQSPAGAPKLSVVTPSFNQAKYLEQTIDSVLSQGYPNLEYIIMDGGSTDGSVEIIKKYARFLAHWQSAPDKGQYAAVDDGFKRSSGALMTWINSDDIFQPGAFNTVVSAFEHFKEIEWLSGRGNNINEAGALVAVAENLPPWSRQRYLEKQYRDPYIQQEGTFWQRGLWQKAGGCLRSDLRFAGDLELWARFFRHAQLHLVDALLASFRSQPSQKTRDGLQQYFAEADQILDEEIRLYNQGSNKTLLPAPPPITIQAAPINQPATPAVNTEFLEQSHKYWNVDSLDEAMYERVVTSDNWAKMTSEQKIEAFNNSGLGSMRLILQDIPAQDNWNILEVGCGVGRIMKPMRQRFARVDGVDISEKMIDFARSYLADAPGNGDVYVNNGYDLQMLSSETYHLVFSMIVFQHIRSASVVHSYFNEIFRVLKPGGYFRLQVHDTSHASMGRADEEAKAGVQYQMDGNCYSPDDLKALFLRHGFEVLTIEHQPPWVWGTARRPLAPPVEPTKPYLVSAIVSTYKSEEFMRGCLEDLERQTIAGKLEIIVVDSASPQNERTIVEEFQQRYDNIVYIRTEKREPLYAAWNRAIHAARGKYITSANTDDRHRHDALEIMANTLETNPQFALVYADQVYTPYANETFETTQSRQQRLWAEYTYQTLRSHCMVSSQPMWRRALHEHYGWFNETFRSAGDWEFWLRIGKTEHFQKINQVLGLYYINPAGIENVNREVLKEASRVHQMYGIRPEELSESTYIEYNPQPQVALVAPQPPEVKPRLSVVIPCYNYAHFLPEALDSVLSQTYRDYEIIIVNDGSTDNTEEVAEAFIHSHPQKRISLLNQPNSGHPASARNSGILQAEGEYIACLDPDDRIAPSYLEKAVAILEAKPHVGVAYCHIQEFGDRDDIYICGEFNLETLARDNVLPYCAVHRRSIWEQVGGYKIIPYEDWDYWISVCERGWEGVLIPEPLFYYRKHGSSRLSEDKSQHDLALAMIVMQHPNTYDEATRHWAAGIMTNQTIEPETRGTVLIALSHFYPSIGGLETIAENLGEQLVELGYQVEIATWTRPDRTSNTHRGMRILSLDDKPMMNNIPQWMLLLRDMITSGKYKACLIMADPLNPFIWTVENAQIPSSTRLMIQPLINKDGYSAWRDDPSFRQRLASILKNSIALALTRSGVEVGFMQEEGIPPVYLPNAVAPPPPSIDFRRQYHIPVETFMLLHVANLWSVKNHLAMLRILQDLPPDWKLVMIGHPTGEPDYVAQVQEELRRRPDVLYIPGLPPAEVSAAMQAADVVLLASKGEVSPVTIMEAMFHAKPWLATPECGSANENAGGLITPLACFVETLHVLRQQPQVARQLGKAGHTHWQACYSWKSVIQAWEELIETGQTQHDFAMPPDVAAQMDALRSQVDNVSQGESEQVLSPMRISAQQSDNPLTLFVEINGLGADIIAQTPYLTSLAENGKPARFIPGLNFIPRPGFFGGLTSAQFGFSNVFCFDPQHSPFNIGRHLPPGLTHPSQVEEDRTRQVFNNFVPGERVTAYAAGYLAKYEIPIEYLPYFDIADPRPPWDRRVRYASMFTELKRQSIPWYQFAAPYQQDYLPGDSDVINEVLDSMPPETRFAYVQLMELDSLGKITSPASDEVKTALGMLDENLKSLVDYLHTSYSQVNVLVVGSHGMVPVDDSVDVWAQLENSGLKYGSDYAFFLDPTLARFWFYNDAARTLVQKALAKLKGVRAMTPAGLKTAGIDGCDPRNGELYYLAAPGTIIFPNFRQRWGDPPRATHGYGNQCKEDEGVVWLQSSRKVKLAEKIRSYEIYPALVNLLGL